MTVEREPGASQRLPPTYYIWLGGALTSLLGDAVLYFALGWAATAHGGAIGGLVLTAVNLPRVLFLVVGGVVGDRFGARRVMIAGDAVMLAGSVALTVLSHDVGPALWLLLAAGTLVGVKDAFYLPASGTMPLRLVGRKPLPRAMAMRQGGGQLVTFLAGPLAGMLMSGPGLTATAMLNAVSFLIILTIMSTIRPAFDMPPAKSRGSFVQDVADGFRSATGNATLKSALLVTAGVSGFLLPVVPLLVPLLARAHHWNAEGAGMTFGAQSLGLLGVTLAVVFRGTMKRPGTAACGGLLVAAVGVGGLAGSPDVLVAAASALLIGAGSGLFASHIGPLVLLSVEQSHVSRMQALLTLVQSVPLLVMNNVLGNLAGLASPTAAIAVCAAAVFGVGLVGFTSARLRNATLEVQPESEPESVRA